MFKNVHVVDQINIGGWIHYPKVKGSDMEINLELAKNTEVHPNFQVYDMLGLAHNKTKSWAIEYGRCRQNFSFDRLTGKVKLSGGREGFFVWLDLENTRWSGQKTWILQYSKLMEGPADQSCWHSTLLISGARNSGCRPLVWSIVTIQLLLSRR